MMKKYSKLLAILLSALLVVLIAIPFVTAEANLLDGQKELYVKSVSVPPVQDGILNGHKQNDVTVDEYGAGGIPSFCLTPDDYRAIDLNGNPLETELPSYIYLYMAKDADALYVGMEIQEKAHSGDKYEFTTFLGFGDGKDADTMNSGTFTTFKMDNSNSAKNDPGTWMDTQVTALSAQKVAADGTVTDTTANRKFNNPVEYMLPAWGSETTMNGKSATFFEAELDFKDAMLGSGLSADADVPEFAYFAFELGVFNGSEKIGTIVFNNDMTGKSDAPDGAIKTVPHVVNLKTDFDPAKASNADISALSIDGGTLTPAFDKDTTEYTVTLKNGVTSANVNVTASAANASRVTIKGADHLGSVNSDNKITVTCVAQSGFAKTYNIGVVFTYDNTDYYVDATAGNDSNSGTSAAPFKTIEKALQTIAAREWEISEKATIHINGTFTATASAEGVLWSDKTVFTKDGTRLPITVKGDSKTDDVINAYAGKVACANSYHFDTLTFTLHDVSTASIYAGSGQVRFDNVNWTTATKISNGTTRFCGDTFTAKVFEGWTEVEIAKAKSQNKDGHIDTSITLGEDADYLYVKSDGSISGWIMSGIGDTGGWSDTNGIAVQSKDLEVSVILDGSQISRMSVFATSSSSATTTYAKVNTIMYSGALHIMQGDTNTSNKATINADVHMAIYGGKSYMERTDKNGSYIRSAQGDTINGDMTFTVESGKWWLIQGAYGGTSVVKGNLEMNIGGTAVIGETATTNSGVYTGGQNPAATAFGGTLTYNVYGDAYISYYRMHGKTVTDHIINNISGGTIYSFIPINAADSKIGLVENNFSGGTITNVCYGAGEKDKTTITVDKVVNSISGDAVINCEFKGTYHANVPVVENNISGGTFKTTYNGTYNSKTKETYTNISGGTFESTCYISYFALEESDLVKNTISGGTFNSTCLFGGYGGKIGKVENHISGGTYVGKNYVYLGAGSTTWPSVVDTVESTITGGDFQMRVYGGSNASHVTTGITNNIEGGSFSVFYGGNNTIYYQYSTDTNSTTGKKSITCNMIGKESFTNTGTAKDGTTYTYTDYKIDNSPYYKKGVEGKIVNNFGKEGAKGPSFSGYVMGAGQFATRATVSTCTVENNIYSGTFNSTYYGGGDNNNGTITSITNNFKGGTFNGTIAGGSYATNVGTITNKFEGGTFNAPFFGGSRRGNISGDVINNVMGGTFNKLFFGGSDQNTTSANHTITNSEKGWVAPVTYTINGSIKNTFTGGVFKTGASGAGFGTIKGNVENTIKGNPNFQLGFYGVQATIFDTVVEGNVLNLITKDENGIAPTFPEKNAAIDYTMPENDACKTVFCTSGSNIGFAATGASGTLYEDSTKATEIKNQESNFTTINGYVETIIEAGQFDGHYYVGGGVEITGANEDGYGAITIVRGDPVFNFTWSGGCISSTSGPAYKTYNEINGGTFNEYFTSFNRTSNTQPNACEVVTVIKDGTFNGKVAFSKPWTNSHANQHQRTAPFTLTIEGGTFNGDVYGLIYRSDTTITGPYLKAGGTLTININGGTFAKNVYAAGNTFTASKFVEDAVIKIAPTKGDITFLGTVAPRFDKEKVELLGGDYKLILGADASVAATSASGEVKIGQKDAWKKQVYVTLPEGNTAKVTVTGTHCFDQKGDSVVAVKGGVQLFGATMILTDRVAVRALFDKTSIEAIDNFTFSFTMDGQTLASGTKADLIPYGEDYYCIVLAKIGANDFEELVTFAGNEMVWENEFSIKGLAISAETAWAGNDEGVALAKAMQNFATIVANPEAELPHTLAPDLSKLNGFKASGTKGTSTAFVATGKGLVMGNAVGIRIYGTSDGEVSANTITVKVNNQDVTGKVVFGGADGSYTIDLYVNAKNMSSALKIEILEKATGKACLTLTDRVDAIAASYPETHEKYDVVQQLLVYIQAAVEYAAKAQA